MVHLPLRTVKSIRWGRVGDRNSLVPGANQEAEKGEHQFVLLSHFPTSILSLGPKPMEWGSNSRM